MTDRVMGFVVTLDKDMRDDDAQAIIDAINLIKGVQSVKPVISEVLGQIIATRVKREVVDRLLELVK